MWGFHFILLTFHVHSRLTSPVALRHGGDVLHHHFIFCVRSSRIFVAISFSFGAGGNAKRPPPQRAGLLVLQAPLFLNSIGFCLL